MISKLYRKLKNKYPYGSHLRRGVELHKATERGGQEFVLTTKKVSKLGGAKINQTTRARYE